MLCLDHSIQPVPAKAVSEQGLAGEPLSCAKFAHVNIIAFPATVYRRGAQSQTTGSWPLKLQGEPRCLDDECKKRVKTLVLTTGPYPGIEQTTVARCLDRVVTRVVSAVWHSKVL